MTSRLRSPPRADALRRLGPLLLLSAGLAAQDAGGGAGAAVRLPSVEEARAEGIGALVRVLPFVESADPGRRLAARRTARLLVADFHAAHVPDGMRLVPARVHVTAAGVRAAGGVYLGEKEVTRGAFRAFAAQQGWEREAWGEGADDLPATGVSLLEARAFAAAADARLPTRDELERAATGLGRFRYPWGNDEDPSRANTREAGRGRLLAAGSLPGGASVHGILDLLGNAAEWTETPLSDDYYCVAGGSYRSALRPASGDGFRTYRLVATARLPDVGFRLARDLPDLPPEVRLAAPAGEREEAPPAAEPREPDPPPGAPLQAPPADGGS